MRYLVQFLVPLIVLLSVAYFALRQSRATQAALSAEEAQQRADRSTFVIILCIGTLAALAIGYGLHNYLG